MTLPYLKPPRCMMTTSTNIYRGVSLNGDTPKSSILNRDFHEKHHPFLGFSPYLRKHPYRSLDPEIPPKQIRCFFFSNHETSQIFIHDGTDRHVASGDLGGQIATSQGCPWIGGWVRRGGGGYFRQGWLGLSESVVLVC